MHTYIKRLPVLRAIILHVYIMFHIWKETSFYAHNISTLLYKYTFIHTLLLLLFLFLVHICALEPNDISRNFVTAMLSVNTCINSSIGARPTPRPSTRYPGTEVQLLVYFVTAYYYMLFMCPSFLFQNWDFVSDHLSLSQYHQLLHFYALFALGVVPWRGTCNQ